MKLLKTKRVIEWMAGFLTFVVIAAQVAAMGLVFGPAGAGLMILATAVYSRGMFNGWTI